MEDSQNIMLIKEAKHKSTCSMIRFILHSEQAKLNYDEKDQVNLSRTDWEGVWRNFIEWR